MELNQNFYLLDINSNCRACLENISDSKHHHKIFATTDLNEKYTVCTSLPIEQDDGLPTNLCEPCCTRIHEFYDFRQMCIASRKKFLDLKNSVEQFSDLELDIKDEQSDILVVNKAEHENKEENADFTNDDNVNSPTDMLTGEDSNDSDDDEPVIKYRSTTKNSPSLECASCHKKFNNAEELGIHKRIHKPFACKQCDKSFARPGRLKEHIRADHEKIFGEKCTHPECDKAFKTKQSLRQHIREFHSSPMGKRGKQLFVCEECGKVLKGKSTLKNHRFLHTGEPRPHECPQCKKRYMTRCKLKEHMNRHAGIKNFECPHCGAKKTSRTELKNHINYHTKEKTYPCVICNMVFNNIVNFSRHKRVVHEGIKNYPCSYCDQSFGKAETRKHHEMTHTGEKPHECTICHKKFIQIVSLKKHQKVHLKAAGKC